MPDRLVVRFRVGGIYENHYVSVYLDGERIQHRRKSILVPGEMEQVILKRDELLAHEGLSEITVCLEEG